VIVVDANVIVYLFIQGDHTTEAKSVLKADPEWTAPYLWRSEFRNVLALYVRKKLLSLTDALAMALEAEALMDGSEYEVAPAAVLNLAAGSNCSAYDCEYVALALNLNVPLVTTDRQLLQEFSSTAVSMESFTRES